MQRSSSLVSISSGLKLDGLPTWDPDIEVGGCAGQLRRVPCSSRTGRYHSQRHLSLVLLLLLCRLEVVRQLEQILNCALGLMRHRYSGHHTPYSHQEITSCLTDPKKTEHLRALDGAGERLHLWKADLLEEGSFDNVIDGCAGVFHTASPFYLSVTDPQIVS